MSTVLPLPRGFFDTNVRLSEDARRRYIEQAESAIRQVFALGDAQRNAWIPVREKKGVAVYRNFSRARSATTTTAHRSNIAEVSGKASLHASLDEIGRAFAAHDDALFRRLMKKLNPSVLDAAVLSTVVPRTPHTPFRYIGVKWFAVKTPTPLVSHRDYCVLEVQDKIVDAYGNEMYLRILSSVDVNECPSLENSHALVRAKLLSGFMYRVDRAEPHVVRVHHVARFDPSGYFPSQWAYKTAEAQLISSIVQLRRIIEKQQMNACTFVDKKQWVPNHARQSCAVCSRSFGTFRPRHHCRCCGEVICGKCSVFKSVDVPGTTLKNVRLCSVCNMGVQKTGAVRDDDDDDAMSDISTSSVTSSQTVAHNEMNMMDLYMTSATTPRTPSAYSSASSTASDLSFRSTASSRSVADRRSRGFSAQRSVPAGLARSGSQRSGLYAPSQTPRSFYESTTPRSYIANNLTPREAPSFGSGDVTPRSESGRLTPSAAAQRMTSFKQHPLDLGYLRDSVASTSSSTHAHAAPPTDATGAADSAACAAIELSAASTASALSSSNSALERDEAAPVGRARAMTHHVRASPVRDAAARRSVSSARRSDDSSAKRPFFGGLFSRTAAAASTDRSPFVPPSS